jgi:DNA-binding NarL/FixJ family response regulator
MIRIIIVDDQMLIREGLMTILDLEDDLEIVALARDGEEGCKLTDEHKPDIVLMDIQMPNMDGLTALKYIKSKYPTIHVLILSTFLDENYIVEAMSRGASGYLLKDIDSDKMIESIRDMMKGQLILPASVASKIVNRLLEDSRLIHNLNWHESLNLTDREKEIALLLSQGYGNKEIESTLYISSGTVRNYISAIYQKLEVVNRSEAINKLNSII